MRCLRCSMPHDYIAIIYQNVKGASILSKILLVQAFYEKKGANLKQIAHQFLFLFWLKGHVLNDRKKVQRNPPRRKLWKSP